MLSEGVLHSLVNARAPYRSPGLSAYVSKSTDFESHGTIHSDSVSPRGKSNPPARSEVGGLNHTDFELTRDGKRNAGAVKLRIALSGMGIADRQQCARNLNGIVRSTNASSALVVKVAAGAQAEMESTYECYQVRPAASLADVAGRNVLSM